MKILIACEFSGIVRDAFIRRGHDAWSCDLLPSERPGPHIQQEVGSILQGNGWDLLIAFPPCTDLAASGARHFPAKIADGRQGRAIDFVRALLAAPVARISVENPVGILSSRIRPPDQIIHPWQFGHEESKKTCLWLRNLPLLIPTDIREIRNRNLTPSGQNRIPPGPERWKIRSRTYEGIANAMAEQWGVDTI